MALKSVWDLDRDAKIAYGDPDKSPAYVEWLIGRGVEVNGSYLLCGGPLT